MENFAQQIFFGLLVELLSLLLAYMFKNRPKMAIVILAVGTLIAGFVAFGSSINVDSPMATPTIETVVAEQESPNDSSILFSENFDNGYAQDFSFYSGDWNVVDDGTGNNVLQMDSPSTCCALASYGPVSLSNGIIEVRIKVIGADYKAHLHVVELGFRSQTTPTNNITQYQLVFDPEESDFRVIYQENGGNWRSLEGVSGSDKSFRFQEGNWFTLRIEFLGENIKIFGDNQLLINAFDSRLDSGRLLIGGNGPVVIQFDDLKVWKLRK